MLTVKKQLSDFILPITALVLLFLLLTYTIYSVRSLSQKMKALSSETSHGQIGPRLDRANLDKLVQEKIGQVTP